MRLAIVRSGERTYFAYLRDIGVSALSTRRSNKSVSLVNGTISKKRNKDMS